MRHTLEIISTKPAKIVTALVTATVCLFLLVGHIQDPNVQSATVYGSLFGLMALGLTLTYITTKVPNFAYGSFVTVGMYVSYTMWRLSGITPYYSAPVSFLFGALASVAIYLGVLRTLGRRGASLVALMIATLALDIGFIGVFGIYSDYLGDVYHLNDAKQFPTIFNADFRIAGVPGVVVAAPVILAVLASLLFIFLTRTKFGVAMRAAVENPNLAQVLGINIDLMYVLAWLLGGGFAALSGSCWILSQRGAVDEGSKLIVEIFAASVLGGLASIYGAVLGGLIIGASEILVTSYLSGIFGPDVNGYQKGVPLLIMIVALILFPQGLVSIAARRGLVGIGRSSRQKYERVRRRVISLRNRLHGLYLRVARH